METSGFILMRARIIIALIACFSFLILFSSTSTVICGTLYIEDDGLGYPWTDPFGLYLNPNVVTVDGTTYKAASLPLSFSKNAGDSFSYSWYDVISGHFSGSRYAIEGIHLYYDTGPSPPWADIVEPISGTITLPSAYYGTWRLRAYYILQYQVTFIGATGGTTNPSGVQWIKSGSSVAISASPSSGYAFKYWNVTGGGLSVADINDPTTTLTVGGTGTVTPAFGQLRTVNLSIAGVGSYTGTALVVDGSSVTLRP
jgi:hypothetical protein